MARDGKDFKKGDGAYLRKGSIKQVITHLKVILTVPTLILL